MHQTRWRLRGIKTQSKPWNYEQENKVTSHKGKAKRNLNIPGRCWAEWSLRCIFLELSFSTFPFPLHRVNSQPSLAAREVKQRRKLSLLVENWEIPSSALGQGFCPKGVLGPSRSLLPPPPSAHVPGSFYWSKEESCSPKGSPGSAEFWVSKHSKGQMLLLEMGTRTQKTSEVSSGDAWAPWA